MTWMSRGQIAAAAEADAAWPDYGEHEHVPHEPGSYGAEAEAAYERVHAADLTIWDEPELADTTTEPEIEP